MIYIIGCGGVGSWLTPSIQLLLPKDRLTLVDGDELEQKNLNRQLFSMADLGRNKAEALADRYKVNSIAQFYSVGMMEHAADDWLLVCVDNNPARVSALQSCDTFGCKALFAANETHSAEAYLYLPEWRDTKLDPRRYYPELLRNSAGDPLRPASCTGEAQLANPQLVSANFMAASLLQHLLVLWKMEVPNIDKEVWPRLPYKLVANLSKLETHRISDAPELEQPKENDGNQIHSS